MPMEIYLRSTSNMLNSVMRQCDKYAVRVFLRTSLKGSLVLLSRVTPTYTRIRSKYSDCFPELASKLRRT